MKKGKMLVASGALFLAVFLSLPFAISAEKPVILKIATWMPAVVPHSRAGMWHVQEVEKRSKGRIKIEYYYSDALIPAKEIVSGLRSGVADMAFVNAAYEPGKLPLCTIGSLPATSLGEYYATAKALADLLKMPEFQAELDQNNILYLGPLPNTSYGVWTKKKDIRTLSDLKGLKIRSLGEQSSLVQAVGGVPVSMTATEIFQAMDKGIMDGGLANPTMAIGYKWEEVCKFYYSIPFGNIAMFVGVNKNSWKKIPADLQKMFVDLHEEACRVSHEIYQGEGERLMEKAMAEQGLKVTQPSAQDIALLKKAAREIAWIKWVKKMEERGLPGQKGLDKWLELLEKYHAQSPFKK